MAKQISPEPLQNINVMVAVDIPNIGTFGAIDNNWICKLIRQTCYSQRN